MSLVAQNWYVVLKLFSNRHFLTTKADQEGRIREYFKHTDGVKM
jgi:hypothetical protein